MNGVSKETLIEICPSPEERKAGKFKNETIPILLDALHHDGVVLLRDVIDVSHLNALNNFMAKEAGEEIDKGVNHRNYGTGNIQQAPPLHIQNLVFDDIYLNKLLFHAVTLYLGDSAKWDFVSGNTALPKSTTRQPVHSDTFEHPRCPFRLMANIPLIDSTVETGATEIWLGGTHRYTPADQIEFSKELNQINPEVVTKRAKHHPGFQPTIPQGSILLRDLRLWHAGMPNQSDHMRCMIGFGFSAAWYLDRAAFIVPEDGGVADRLRCGALESGVKACTVSKPIETYLERKNLHVFDNAE